MIKKDTELSEGYTFGEAVNRFNAIFRGFYKTLSGKELIKVEDCYYQGKWIYWNEYGILLTTMDKGCYKVAEVAGDLIPQTSGFFVRFDDYGVAIFEHDLLEISIAGVNKLRTEEVSFCKAASSWWPFNCGAEIVRVECKGSKFDLADDDPVRDAKRLGKLLSVEELNDVKLDWDALNKEAKLELAKEGASSSSVEGYHIVTDKHEFYVLIDNEQDCCETWGHFSTNDNLSDFIGKQLVDIRLTDTALNTQRIKEAGADSLDEGGIQFVDFCFDDATVLQLVVYNAHNGYYGHSIYLVEDGKVLFTDIL